MRHAEEKLENFWIRGLIYFFDLERAKKKRVKRIVENLVYFQNCVVFFFIFGLIEEIKISRRSHLSIELW